MAVVGIKVGGRDYHVACDDGQEEHLRYLADEVNDRIHSLFFGAKTAPSEQMALLMSALMLVDELLESKRENEKLTQIATGNGQFADDSRMIEMESAMAITLEEIAGRIEKIAGEMEVS